jgi:hypothetical protein
VKAAQVHGSAQHAHVLPGFGFGHGRRYSSLPGLRNLRSQPNLTNRDALLDEAAEDIVAKELLQQHTRPDLLACH